MKKCSKCKLGKFVMDFVKKKSNKDGLCSQCKACQKRYREAHRQEASVYHKQYVQTNKKKLTIQSKQYRQKMKETVFDHYGYCQCCGESNLYFLTIDHINNDGVDYRGKIGGWSGTAFYRWIIKNNFPKDLQSFCWNCNEAKYHSGLGFCPHKVKKIFFP